MAKGQKRSNREAKKPKQTKPKLDGGLTPLSGDQVKEAVARDKKR